MSVFNNIQNALNAKLASLSGLPAIFYQNIQNEPAQGTSYIRPTLLPARSTLLTLNNEDMHQGLYQIDIYTQLKKGTAPILLLADIIRDGFKRQSLVSSSTVVHVQNISISPIQRIESWCHCYVEVNYLCVA
jgi:hypothetical protein